MKKSFDAILLLLCILPLGFDKLYKKDMTMFLYKFITSFIVVGIIWWLYDLICVCAGRYQVNPFK